ncbi:MAG: hypothetical protein LBT40_17005 [Deltaproteobacteria bacterium]|nr:hypothetical protein [Deltaproteobacteria bacterium]
MNALPFFEASRFWTVFPDRVLVRVARGFVRLESVARFDFLIKIFFEDVFGPEEVRVLTALTAKISGSPAERLFGDGREIFVGAIGGLGMIIASLSLSLSGVG